MARTDPFEPVLGEDIGPSPVKRAASGVALVALLVFLGVLAALGIGLVIVLLWAAFTAALG